MSSGAMCRGVCAPDHHDNFGPLLRFGLFASIIAKFGLWLVMISAVGIGVAVTIGQSMFSTKHESSIEREADL